MDLLKEYLPSTEQGYLPVYLFFIGLVAIGNSAQNYFTLHYTRRIYNGRFVTNHSLPSQTERFDPEDSTSKLKPASSTGKDSEKARDQVTPLAARLFGTYTFMAGVVRMIACYQLENKGMYWLGIWTHVIAAVHFTSEWLGYGTIRFTGPQGFSFAAAYGGMLWMGMQYHYYVQQ
ncbi:hypothetical protein QBC37DRAFT_390670 [Rhypophila decipiens]|uniref:Ergosterol biosynthetic protein 28 n=1 Tax=Rhypophila decipiens TaxID=261697 RepID=A0AAN6Y0T3_9PEZI|nr:hypothetical protein QBC37DRAFT_390670 [Rhypophila decipiens]